MTLKQILREILSEKDGDDQELIKEFFDQYWESVNSLFMFTEHYNKDKEFVDAYKKLVEIGNRLGDYADKQGYR